MVVDEARSRVAVTAGRASGKRLWRLTSTPLVEGEADVLMVEGRLGYATAAELEAAAARVLDRGATCLVIDLSEVDYLSGAALQVLKSLAARQAARGGQLTLRSPSVSARLTLELSGLLNLVVERADP